MTTLVLTVIGDDRPGLVKALADAVHGAGGNWGRSQLAQLAGQFAGLVEVEVDDGRADDLVASLQSLDGLDVIVRSGTEPVAPSVQQWVLDLVGNDHPGIVAEVTSALASHGVNIERLDTSTEQAPMAGGTLFRAHVVLTGPADLDPAAITVALEHLADELMVELSLERPEG